MQDISTLTFQVLSAAFLLSTLFGFITQKNHFCTMGAISDILNMQEWTRMRMWAVASGTAVLGFAALSFLGLINPTKTLYSGTSSLWLSALVGGLLFGIGMVLASGCASKNLLRLSSGNLKALVVLIVMGFAAIATLKGITAVVRVNTLDLFTFASPILGSTARNSISFIFAIILFSWALRAPAMRHFSIILPNVLIGLVVTGMWFVSGDLGYVPEHPDTLQEAFIATNSGRMESLSFVAPVAYIFEGLMFFSDKSQFISIGMISVLGVIFGGFISTLRSKTFRWEGFMSIEDLINHLIGGLMMGVGGVTAMGCTIGNGLSGFSTLAPASFIALAGIFSGAFLAFKYQVWRLN